MIIGDGLIASAFKDYSNNEDIIIFASGVSNSQEINQKNFIRERLMLLKVVQKNKLLIYFSTCSLYDKSLEKTPYISHKLYMETIVKCSKRFIIFRLPQVVGKSKNLSTLTNYLYRAISENIRFPLWQNAYRNIIDIDDIKKIADIFIKDSLAQGSTINIANPFMISMHELVKIFENLLHKKAKYDLVNKGSDFKIDTAISKSVAQKLKINFEDRYIEKVITKYYK